jgi:putative ABC transport system substrate-binding protein
MAQTEADEQSRSRVAAFERALSRLGWNIGRDLLIEYRWAGTELVRQRVVTELLADAPHAILVASSQNLAALLSATRDVPIVFVRVSEPVSQGFVASLARPGGNATGFTNLEWTFGEKWLELIRQIAPHLSHVGVLFNPLYSPQGILFFKSVQQAAQMFKLEIVLGEIREEADFEHFMLRVANAGRGGLICPPDSFMTNHRRRFIDLASRHGIPAIYSSRTFPADGGLISYGVDVADQLRHAADYIDRILRGVKPSDLPVQQPTKFELVINLKTAKALGLEIPPTLLARADEVIE